MRRGDKRVSYELTTVLQSIVAASQSASPTSERRQVSCTPKHCILRNVLGPSSLNYRIVCVAQGVSLFFRLGQPLPEPAYCVGRIAFCGGIDSDAFASRVGSRPELVSD